MKANKYYALLSSRYAALAKLIYEEQLDRFFFVQNVAGYLYNAVAPETDILVAMALAANLQNCSILSTVENDRLIKLEKAIQSTDSLSSADAGILAALTIVRLEKDLDYFERADSGWLKCGDSNYDKQYENISTLGFIYEKVKNHPMGNVLYSLIQRAMQACQIEAPIFIDERPVYEISCAAAEIAIPEMILKMIRGLYLCYSSNNGILYVSHVGMEARTMIPYLMTIIQAHHPEVDIRKSEKKYSEIAWERKSCCSFITAIHRSCCQSPLKKSITHAPNEPIDPYRKIIKNF